MTESFQIHARDRNIYVITLIIILYSNVMYVLVKTIILAFAKYSQSRQ